MSIAAVLGKRSQLKNQAASLLQPQEDSTLIFGEEHKLIEQLKRQADRLGGAGYITDSQRKSFYKGATCLGILVLLTCYFFGGLLALLLGLYAYGAVIAVYLRYLTSQRQNEVNFFLPLTLQLLSLLVQSGFGLLPAMEKVVSSRNRKDPVTFTLYTAYELTASGLTFQDALKLVAMHCPYETISQTLLHLDLAGNEGGELTPALNKLTDHTQLQWKLSVEGRVRKLENLVVFPVFASVLGLLFLVTAGPIVPVVDFMDSIKKPSIGNEQ